MNIELRNTLPDDEAFLLAVYGSARAEELALVPWSDEQRAAFLKMQLTAQHAYYREHFPDAHYKVILQNGEPVGRLYILKRDEGIRILDISLLPEHRNRGVGTLLIQELLNEGTATGRTVRIFVENFNPSLRLFQRLGFSVIDQKDFNLLLEWPSNELKQISRKH
jgi:ribosomal protein S18 acetylase RimI-like enzyme